MTRVTQHKSDALLIRKAQAGIESLARRPGAAPSGTGFAVLPVEVFEATVDVIAGDGVFEFEIMEDLEGATLVKVDAYLVVPSSSGTVQVQLHKIADPGGGAGADMLSTLISIDVGEYNMRHAGTQPVIIGAQADVSWGDHIRVDVDNAGAGAKGLGLICYFVAAETADVTINGAKGDPGGVANWGGAWAGATTYVTSTSVSYGGTSYVSITSVPAGIIPGVTPGWEAYWQVLAQRQLYTTLTVEMNGQGRLIDVGMVAIVPMEFPATIVGWRLMADQPTNMVMDVWKDTYAAYPPTIADTIVSTSPPQLVSANRNVDTVVSGWTTALLDGDTLTFYVVSNSNARFAALNLKLQRL